MVNLAVGDRVVFLYPAHNFLGVDSELEQRRARVMAIDDSPVADWAVKKNPLRNRRGRRIVMMDLDKGRERTFYEDCMVNAAPLTDAFPDAPHDVVLLAGDDSPELVHRAADADEALAFARHWLREPLGYGVGILPQKNAA